MEIQDPIDPHTIPYAQPVPRRTFWMWIADRNPFFLVSAVCMLWGCLSLTNSSSWNSVPLSRLLLLICTLNLYEGLLIAVSLLLLRRQLLRDGRILLILEAFFLVDVAFLNAEVATANLQVGLIVNATLLLLAAVKLLALRSAIPAELSGTRLGFILLQMAVLLGLPSWFRYADNGSLSPLLFYGAWWVVGLMPAAGLLIRKLAGNTEASPFSGIDGFWVCLPWVSMIAHVGILHYAYDVSFEGPMLTPVFLGLTLGLTRLHLPSLSKDLNASSLKWILPIAAVLASTGSHPDLVISLPGHPSMGAGPLMLALAGTYFTCVYCYCWRYARYLVLGGGAAAMAAVFGPSVTEIELILWDCWNRVIDITNVLMPNNRIQWGIVSVVASFFFLVLGTLISLRRQSIERSKQS